MENKQMNNEEKWNGTDWGDQKYPFCKEYVIERAKTLTLEEVRAEEMAYSGEFDQSDPYSFYESMAAMCIRGFWDTDDADVPLYGVILEKAKDLVIDIAKELAVGYEEEKYEPLVPGINEHTIRTLGMLDKKLLEPLKNIPELNEYAVKCSQLFYAMQLLIKDKCKIEITRKELNDWKKEAPKLWNDFNENNPDFRVTED